MRAKAIAALCAIGLMLAAPLPAEAHAFLRRYDLPLPLWHYLIAAGLAVAVSFAILGMFRTERERLLPRGIDLSGTLLDRVLTHRRLEQLLGLAAVSSLIFLLAAGFFGTQEDPFRNILPVFIWVGWWIGFAFFCALVGNVWPAVNPWAPVGRAIERVLRRRPARSLPRAVGVWPATICYLAFAWAELVWPDNAHPDALAVAILVYSLVTWSAMARYGTERWLRCGEAFSLIFELFGRFAPLGRDAKGRLTLRFYGAGLLSDDKVPPSMVAFVLALLAIVSFDGFLHTPPWASLFNTAFSASYDLGLIDLIGNTGTRTLIMTAGLLAAPLIFLAVFLAICKATAALMAGAGGSRPRAIEIAGRYALTLVPIAIAYHLAHYLSLLLIEGQRLVALMSDPFGAGWNLFGAAGRVPDIDIVDARFLWLFAAGVVVAGHVIAVTLAHEIALRTCTDRRQALVSQLPMLALMIAYTMLSLWILAQPIVEAG